MYIRKASSEDFDEMKAIYAYARKMMRENGNPNQWKNNRPSDEAILKDIENGNSYCVIDADEKESCVSSGKNEKICGVFAFILGTDPTYLEIEGGEWLNDEPYGTIHRMAAAEGAKGIFDFALSFCEKQTDNIRLDTHEENLILQRLAEKRGFKKCGIIYVDNGTPRIAYQKIV